MSKTIKSDCDARKAAYWEEKKAKSDPSHYKRQVYAGMKLYKARQFAKTVNVGKV